MRLAKRLSPMLTRTLSPAFFLAITLLANPLAWAEQAEIFPLSSVELKDGPLLHAMQVNRELLLRYRPDRLLAPFLREAGLEPKAAPYANWENTGLDGHTAGHYLSALANYAAQGDEKCQERLDYMVSEIARCQAASEIGYVGGIPNGNAMWREIAAGDIRSSGFSLNGRWVPLYNLHKTFAGLRDAHLLAGNEQAKQVLTKLADWCDNLVTELSDQQVQQMLVSEHGGMNEVLADVADITGNPKYLDLAESFSHRAILDPLAAGEDKLTGLHANTQVPKVIGFERIAALGRGDKYHEAAQFFWKTVVNNRSVALGGNSISEHFPSEQQSIGWIEGRQGPETCNTYNMLRLTEQLFEADAQPRFADFYERAVFNHILSSQHPVHGGYVYFTPLRPQHYRVYSNPDESFWCCVGSGMENHGKYGQFIYAHNDDSLFVNLFVASKLDWKQKHLKLSQQTNFPDESRTELVISAAKPTDMTLHVRHPQWVAQDAFQVAINGEELDLKSKPSSYVSIKRTWNDGDRIEVTLPMRTVAEPLPHLDDYVALVHGPIVLAAKTGSDDLDGLVAGAGRMDHVAEGALRPLLESPMLVTDSKDPNDWIDRQTAGPLKFHLAGVVRPRSFDGLELIPFFRIHDARYMIYWRQLSPQEYDSVLDEMQASEQAKIVLDKATVDRVAPGEQQPETEHHFQGQDTTTGIWRDRRFRHAEGWFSYDLQAGAERDLALRVTYFGSDRRRFNILVNDQLLAEVQLDAPKPDEFVDVEYPIRREVVEHAKDGTLTVKFAAAPNSMAGGIFDVRLVQQTEAVQD